MMNYEMYNPLETTQIIYDYAGEVNSRLLSSDDSLLFQMKLDACDKGLGAYLNRIADNVTLLQDGLEKMSNDRCVVGGALVVIYGLVNSNMEPLVYKTIIDRMKTTDSIPYFEEDTDENMFDAFQSVAQLGLAKHKELDNPIAVVNGIFAEDMNSFRRHDYIRIGAGVTASVVDAAWGELQQEIVKIYNDVVVPNTIASIDPTVL